MSCGKLLPKAFVLLDLIESQTSETFNKRKEHRWKLDRQSKERPNLKVTAETSLCQIFGGGAVENMGSSPNNPSGRGTDEARPASPLKDALANPHQATLNNKLCQARDFLRSPSPYMGYSFALRHRSILEFLHNLSEKEAGYFDQDLYDDVQSWLDVRAPQTDPERQWDFLEMADRNDKGSGDPLQHTSLIESEGDGFESDGESSGEGIINEVHNQFFFGETTHLQTLMSNQIERDLAGDTFKLAMPLTTKFALPKAPWETIEEIQGSGLAPSCLVSH